MKLNVYLAGVKDLHRRYVQDGAWSSSSDISRDEKVLALFHGDSGTCIGCALRWWKLLYVPLLITPFQRLIPSLRVPLPLFGNVR